MNTEAVKIRRKKPIPMPISPRDLFKKVHELNNINFINRWDLTSLACFLYLTGARVSEALDLKRSNLEIKDSMIIVNIKTLKSRIYPLRILPLGPIKSDKPYYKIFHKFLTSNNYEEDDFIFPFQSRFIINKYFRMIKIEKLLQLDPNKKKWIEQDLRLHPHYLRHCRLSHMATIFNFNELELMRFAGWTSIKPAVFYVKLTYKDLLKKMISPDLVTDYAEKYLRAV